MDNSLYKTQQSIEDNEYLEEEKEEEGTENRSKEEERGETEKEIEVEGWEEIENRETERMRINREKRERNKKIVLESLMEEIPEEEYEEIVRRVNKGEDIKQILKEIGVEESEISNSKLRSLKRFPWEEIERIYTNGRKKYLNNGKIVLEYPTLAQLAKIYGCSEQTIRIESMNRKWGIKRDLLKKRRRQDMYKETYSTLLNEATMHDAKLLGRLQRIEELMENQLDLVEEATNLEERIDPREMKSLLECLEKSHSIARKLYGEPMNLYDMEKEIDRMKREKEEDKKIKSENAVNLLETLLRRKERLERKKENKLINMETIEVEVINTDTED